jgi:hypothetical protein
MIAADLLAEAAPWPIQKRVRFAVKLLKRQPKNAGFAVNFWKGTPASLF